MRGIEEKDIENMPKILTSHASENGAVRRFVSCTMPTNEILDSISKMIR
jgi:hypothetical protein